MNNKNLQILKKITLLILVIVALTFVLSSCTSNTVLNIKGTDEKYWEGANVNTAASTGFLDVILLWIGKFLGWITEIMPANSYILTLLVFGIILEILMLPFGIKQQKNWIKQARLRPKEMAIRKKYAGRNDQATQQKVTQEIQELYQKENFNPMSGCVAPLLQLPIIMVLYWIVVDPIQYVCGMGREVSSALGGFIANKMGESLSATNGSIEILTFIHNKGPQAFIDAGIETYFENGAEMLGAVQRIYDFKANFNIGPLNFGATPSFDFTSINAWLLAIPVLTFIVYFFSMKLSRKFMYQPTQNADDRQQACSNNMMDITMPLMSVLITFNVPAAIAVYWMFKSVLGTVKQFVMSKVMPLPKFSEEDYKAAEKEYLGKQPKKIEKSANAGKVRSLHHIDDEDYDEKGNYIGSDKILESTDEPYEEEEQEKAPETLPENSMTEGASLKDDSDKNTKKSGLFSKKNKKD